jgi:hypothetical protein
MKTVVIFLVGVAALAVSGVFAEEAARTAQPQTQNANEVSYQKNNELRTYSGCISEPCSVQPGGALLSFKTHETLTGQYTRPGDYRDMIVTTRYIGREGEHGFSIDWGIDIHSIRQGVPSFNIGDPKKNGDYVMVPNEVIPISRALHPSCPDGVDQTIKLKMIGFKGNSLTHQIILPECMTRK